MCCVYVDDYEIVCILCEYVDVVDLVECEFEWLFVVCVGGEW